MPASIRGSISRGLRCTSQPESARPETRTFAARWEPNGKAFYEKLLAKGNTKMQALVAVMRKILHAIHGMLEHDQDFDNEKFSTVKG